MRQRGARKFNRPARARASERWNAIARAERGQNAFIEPARAAAATKQNLHVVFSPIFQRTHHARIRSAKNNETRSRVRVFSYDASTGEGKRESQLSGFLPFVAAISLRAREYFRSVRVDPEKAWVSSSPLSLSYPSTRSANPDLLEILRFFLSRSLSCTLSSQ